MDKNLHIKKAVPGSTALNYSALTPIAQTNLLSVDRIDKLLLQPLATIRSKQQKQLKLSS
jgi:hypothetical protein